MIAVEGLRRVAVVVRTHVDGPKVRELLAALSKGALFDLYVLANETSGPLDLAPYAKLPHTLTLFEDLGFGPRNLYFLTHCSDLLFAHIAEVIPGYDVYALMEFDVHLTRGDAAAVDLLVRALSSKAYGDVDLACVALRPSGPKWMWHASAAGFFQEVWACFFPVLCLSSRAISHIRARRLDELAAKGSASAKGDGSPDDWVFCEAFVPSALREVGYRMVDLNDIFPGFYRWSAFNWGPIWLMGEPITRDRAAELVHPVLEPEPFLEKYFHWATQTGRAREFLEDLERDRWRLPRRLTAPYEQRAAAAAATTTGR